MRRASRSILVIMVACGAGPALAGTQPATQPARVASPSEQCALDDATQRLTDTVLKTRLTKDLTVAGLLASTEAGERALREIIYSRCQRGPARQRLGGGLQMDVWLHADDLKTSLDEICKQYLPASTGITTSWSHIPPLISAEGSCTTDEVLVDLSGWRHCAPEQVEQAQRAALLDAQQALLDHLANLRLTPTRTVGDLIIRHPAFLNALRDQIETVRPTETVLESTGLCRSRVMQSRGQVVSLLAAAARASKTPIQVDFAKVSSPTWTDTLTVDGFGVAPPVNVVQTNMTKFRRDRQPAWVDRFVTVAAAGRAPAYVTDLEKGRELAGKAARMEAHRRLWIQIEALTLPGGETIGDFLKDHPEAVETLAPIDDFMFPTSVIRYDEEGTATISVGLRLQTVWRLLQNLKERQ